MFENSEPTNFNLESLFKKDFRLNTTSNFDSAKFDEYFGNKTRWGFVCGRQSCGKSTVAKEIGKVSNSHVIDMVVITEEVKKRLAEAAGEDAEAPEEVPIGEIEKAICAIVKGHVDSGKKIGYVFDGHAHKSGTEFLSWACESFGKPSYWMPVDCSDNTINERWKKRNEAEDIPEDA
jgi:thymidylate kinase